jgi:hypothetical protein
MIRPLFLAPYMQILVPQMQTRRDWYFRNTAPCCLHKQQALSILIAGHETPKNVMQFKNIGQCPERRGVPFVGYKRRVESAWKSHALDTGYDDAKVRW